MNITLPTEWRLYCAWDLTNRGLDHNRVPVSAILRLQLLVSPTDPNTLIIAASLSLSLLLAGKCAVLSLHASTHLCCLMLLNRISTGLKTGPRAAP